MTIFEVLNFGTAPFQTYNFRGICSYVTLFPCNFRVLLDFSGYVNRIEKAISKIKYRFEREIIEEN